jgi:transcriptional regulator with PAS, ATPase and Fis domain
LIAKTSLVESHDLVGTSSVIRELVAAADQIAATHSKVLLTGESGVGKEVLARYIHRHSLRSRGPMIAINCTGLAETLLESELFGHVRGSFTDAHRDHRGLFETAHDGTVLLDEVGEMSMRMQALLLRFLETGEIQPVGSDQPTRVVDVRLIAATNRDLLEETRLKTFREDLYYRLNVVHLIVPPLRDRREDIKALLDHFLRVAGEREHRPICELTPEAEAHLEAYRWPGNIRELRNVAERLVVRYSGRTVSLLELPAEVFEHEGRLATPDTLQEGRTQARLRQAAICSSCHSMPTPDDVCYQRMVTGKESFWTVVCQPFMRHDMMRASVRAIVRRGLEQTHGNYSSVAQLFNLPPSDYKRFLSFLQKYDCHMPFQQFRMVPASRTPREGSEGSRAAGTAGTGTR